MRAVLVALLALGACASQRTPAAVYGMLVEAGCMAPADDGISTIAAEHARKDQPDLECLFGSSSTLTSCGITCTPPDGGHP